MGLKGVIYKACAKERNQGSSQCGNKQTDEQEADQQMGVIFKKRQQEKKTVMGGKCYRQGSSRATGQNTVWESY